jgi:hypothetical protein
MARKLRLEYPGAIYHVINLVAGMKWFLGTYTGRFNRRHKLFGHGTGTERASRGSVPHIRRFRIDGLGRPLRLAARRANSDWNIPTPFIT